MCNLKTKQIQQKQPYRHSEQIGDCKRGGEWVLNKIAEGA